MLTASWAASAWPQDAAPFRPICRELVLVPAELPDGYLHYPYSQTITASGGTGPSTFAVTAGSLPPGFALSAEGVLAGLSGIGSSAFTVTATDAVGCTGRRDYVLEIVCAPLVLSPDTLPGGNVDVAYSQTITVGGATSPTETWLKSGTLPFGLSLSWAGGPNTVLSGTPVLGGTYDFELEAWDGCSYGSRAYQVVIRAGPIGQRAARPRAAVLPERRGR